MNEQFVVLLVEDHRPLAESIGAFFQDSGITVDYASTGPAALQLAVSQTYDAIILDIGLPGVDGLEVCRRLRQHSHLATPIIMLTARDHLDDKLAGFDAGADDYLVKPFAMPELEARLLAIIRRRRAVPFQDRYEIGDLVLDAARFTVTRAGRAIRLSAKQFDLLHLLMRESPKLVSRETVERTLWGDAVPDSDALRSHFYNLRKLVDKDYAVELIETIPGKGFRLVPPPDPAS